MQIRKWAMAITVVGLTASTLPAQEPGKTPQNTQPTANPLESLIADAMKHNADIQAAAAKVREAEIALNQIRSEVMVRVATQFEIEKIAKESMETAQKRFALMSDLNKKGQVSPLEMIKAEAELNEARVNVSRVRAETMRIVGHVPGLAAANPGNSWLSYTDAKVGLARSAHHGGPLHLWAAVNANLSTPPASDATPGSITEKLRAALSKSVKLDKELKGVSPKDALLAIQAKCDFPMRFVLGSRTMTPVDLEPGEMPLSAWLAAIQDSVQELRLVVREYGLLVTTEDRLPPDGLLLSEFLRRSTAKEVKADQAPKTK